MLIVLAIIVLITAVALVSQTSFNRSLLLTDTAYTIALSIRQMQTYGLSGQRPVVGAPSDAGYGAYFTLGSTYTLFADLSPAAPGLELSGKCPGHTADDPPESRPGDCQYVSTADTAVSTYRLERGFRISEFCGRNTGGTIVCSPTLTSLNITFLRPNTESVILANPGTIELTSASIELESPDGGATRLVCVTKVGQVSVATSTCPL